MTIELPEGYKPSPDEEYMSPQQLEYFRRKLLDWRNELLQESENTINHLKEERKRTGRSRTSTIAPRWKPMPRWNCAPGTATAS